MKNTPYYLPVLCCLLIFGMTSCDQCKQDNITIQPGDTNITPQPNPFRPPTDLPPITQHGANTFGCRVNGENWVFWIPPFAITDETSFVVNEEGGTLGYSLCRARIWRDTLYDGFLFYNSIAFSFLNPSFETKSYHQTTNGPLTEDNFRFRLVVHNDQGKWYYPDTIQISNYLIIDRLDRDSHIVAGRFNLVLYRGWNYEVTDRTDSVVITDGRFDFIYEEY